MGKGFYKGVIFFDINKGLDIVDHDILLSKLKKYGVVGLELTRSEFHFETEAKVDSFTGEHDVYNTHVCVALGI